MSESPKDKDQKQGDELLKRMLKTPPKPRKEKSEKEHSDKTKGKPGN